MMKKLHKFSLITVLIPIIFLSGCTNTAKMQNSSAFKYSSYRNIPGVTADELNSVEKLRAKYGSFVFGSVASTESFYGEDGSVSGFTALLCEWLSGLFDIPFVPQLHEWQDLVPGLESGAINFTGDLTSQNNFPGNNFLTTETINSHIISYMQIDGSDTVQEISGVRPPRLVFLENSAALKIIAPLVDFGNYEISYAGNIAGVYKMLKSGEADAFVGENYLIAGFDIYGDVIARNFQPLAYSSVALTALNPELEPIISIIQKALENGGSSYLTQLYNSGQADYRKYKFSMLLTDEEKNYIQEHPVIPFVAQIDNYPLSFYNKYEKQFQGIAFDLLAQVQILTGLTFNTINDQNTEWPVLLNMLEEGKASIISELIPMKEREGKYLWASKNAFTEYYALISKGGFHNIDFSEIKNIKIGLARGTAFDRTFRKWFPDHKYVTEYETMDAAFKALENGEVEMVMAGTGRLLHFTNYEELANYKANYIFDLQFSSAFGFNKNETVLCSIVNKALGLIDVDGISGQWIRKTADYKHKMDQALLPWMVGATALLFTLLLSVVVLVYNRRGRDQLKKAVEMRTAEIKKQHSLISALNSAASVLLTVNEDTFRDSLVAGMELLGRCIDMDRVILWQNETIDGALYFVHKYEWLSDIAKEKSLLQPGIKFSYRERSDWENIFLGGGYISSPFSQLPPKDQDFFRPYQVKSVILIPLFMNNRFWGLFTLDDCRSERSYSEDEINILQSAGLLLISAITRNEMLISLQNESRKTISLAHWYKSILDAAPFPISVTDEDMKWTFVNTAAEDFLGLKRRDMIGNPCSNWNSEVCNTEACGIACARRGLKQTFFTHRDASYQADVAILKNMNGGIAGYIEIIQDITKIEIMGKKQAEAEAASVAKSAFLANMSHEI
ncbi:MAG: transporter substrate-binding domain-containing protein, partial [Treponema sp.]|nr:transporter substrate-binding domain-containing protein [Treponema sp.]